MPFANALKLDKCTLGQTLLLSTFFGGIFITFLFEHTHIGSSMRNVKMLLMVLLSLCRSSFMPTKTAHGSITFYIQAVGGFLLCREIFALYNF